MLDDDDKPQLGKSVREMMPQDLSALSVEELQDWIAFMQSEITRAEAGIAAKNAVRTGADALFSFKG